MSKLRSGPFIKFGDYALQPTPVWHGSILVVTEGPDVPSIFVKSLASEVPFQSSFQVQHLDNAGGFQFFRFDVSVPAKLGQGAIVYSYKIYLGDVNISEFDFHVAGSQDVWRWGFWSCNGFSKETEDTKKVKFAALWEDILQNHSKIPLMLQVGGGDQVYADPVFNQPCLVEWLAIKGKENRRDAPWTPKFEEECSKFYFELYANHFMTPFMREALARIPYAFQGDDHDFFDGWGSYPDYIQKSTLFENLGRVAYRFYLLFQMHTTPNRAPYDGYIGFNNSSYSFVKQMGPEMALLGVDTRKERNLTQIVHPESSNMIFARLDALPASTRHLIVLLGVPIAYPDLQSTESTLHIIGDIKETANHAVNALADGIGKFFGSEAKKSIDSALSVVKKSLGKEGLMSKLVNKFGEMELTDDLTDHWTFVSHRIERQYFVRRLQSFAQARQCRVTFISGDVHVAGCSFFESAKSALPPTLTPPSKNVPANRITDHRYMVQIISSAIINLPPPSIALNSVLSAAKRYTGPEGLDEDTIEDMEVIFDVDVNGEPYKKKLLARRNWCLISPDDIPGQLLFELRTE
ncbi:hypothetical protein HK096_008683, partial [Nowakowskiella sp. JEL0078]